MLAYAPGVLVSTLLTLILGVLLPAPGGWVVFLGSVLSVTVLLSGRAEPVAVRAWFRARRPTPAESAALAPMVALLCQRGLGPPVVDLWVQPRVFPVSVSVMGRRSVVLSGGLIATVRTGKLPTDQAAALGAHAAGVLRAGAVRSDAALMFWTLPWQVLRGFSQGSAQAFSGLPLVAWAWRLRFVVGVISLVQSWNEGSVGAKVGGCLAAAVITLSYLIPRWESAWAATIRHLGDEQAKQAGLAEPLARFLRRCSSTPATFERIHRLQLPSEPTRPALSLVTNPDRNRVT